MERMMIDFRWILIAVFGSMFIASCSPRLTPFTRNVYESSNFADADLKKVQFYLSEDLVLYRSVEEVGDVRIAGGEIKMVNGKKIEQIRFRKGTPGVFLFRPKEDHFAISFESGDDTKYLMFGPNPKRAGQYMLLASEWNRRSGKVTYSGKKFQTSSPDVPRLMVNMDHKKIQKVSNREASGRKIK